MCRAMRESRRFVTRQRHDEQGDGKVKVVVVMVGRIEIEDVSMAMRTGLAVYWTSTGLSLVSRVDMEVSKPLPVVRI
jgi:hypothetical protein